MINKGKNVCEFNDHGLDQTIFKDTNESTDKPLTCLFQEINEQ